MKWLVTNALSRDVERQHLNKILADIRLAMDDVVRDSKTPTDDVRAIVGTMVEGNSEQGLSVTYNVGSGVLDFAVNDFIISLTGDVTGQGTVSSLRNVNIPVTIDPSKVGIPEAPIDNNAYWRIGGEWNPVPWEVMKLDTVEGEGFMVHGYDEEGRAVYYVRQLEVDAGELTLANADAIAGNPVLGLAEVVDSGTAAALVKVDHDEFGRVTGTEQATAADLPYVDTTTPPLDATDVQDAIETLATALAPFIGLSPTDGDILEFDGSASAWATTKNPRELYLDGGNF